MEVLWKIQQNFKSELERRVKIAMYDEITIKELLDLGFNNNYLQLGDRTIELGYIDEDGNYSEELTKEQLNAKVYMKEDFDWYDDENTDDDGYYIARVNLLNKKDKKLFD